MTAVTSARSVDSRQLWFGLDAVVTGVNALGYLLLAGLLNDVLGGGESTLRWIGALLLGFVVLVGWVAANSARQPAAAWLVVVVNVAWTIGSVVVAVADPLDLTDVGQVWAVLQALVVGGFAVMQARVLSRP